MPMTPVASLVDAISKHGLLDLDQEADLAMLGARFTDPRALVKELVRREWLTTHQANKVLQGKAGELVMGSYVLMEKLGEGGMGAVYKARHKTMSRVVALKLIRPERLSNPEAVKRFRREIKVAAQLNHPNIVLAFDADEVAGVHFFTMEYVEGSDLGKLTKKDGPLPVADACEYIRQAALGLQHAYERGLIHRDIKPSNLLVSGKRPAASGQQKTSAETSAAPAATPPAQPAMVKILDMGLARAQAREHGDASTSMLTQTGMVMGTPDFIAPEQARESHDVDIRADLYSLGCTLYYILTGKVPFPTGALAAKLLQHQMDEPVPVEERRPEVAPAVGAVLRKLMAKKPADRYQTPAEAAAALGAALGQPGPEPSRPAPVPGPAAAAATLRPTPSPQVMATPIPQRSGARPRPPGGRRLWPLLAGGGSLLAAIAILVALLFHSRTESPRTTAPEVVKTALERLGEFGLPAEDRFPDHPPELAAVLGEQRGRHWAAIRCVAWSPDGQTIASGGDDKVVRLWDAATLREKAVLQHPVAVYNAAFSPDGKVLAVGPTPVRLWDLSKSAPELRATLDGQANRGFTANGRQLLTFDNKGRKDIYLWDLGDPMSPARRPLEGQSSSIAWAALSRDGRTLATLSADDLTVRVWDLGVDPPALREFKLPAGQKAGPRLALSPNGKLAAVSTSAGVFLWDLTAADLTEPLCEVQKGGGLTDLEFAPDGKELACLTTTGVQRYDISGSRPEPRGPRFEPGVCLTYSADSRALVVGSGKGLFPWIVSGPDPVEPLALLRGDKPLTSLVFFRGARTLATESTGDVAIWDLADQQLLRTWASGGSGLALHPNGRYLVTRNPKSVAFWDPSLGTDAGFIPLADGGSVVAYSPNDRFLATTLGGKTVKLLDARTGAELQSWTDASTRLAFSPDSRLLATSAKVFETGTGTEVFAPGGNSSVAFRPDGQLLAVGRSNNTTLLFDPATWQAGTAVPGKTNCVAFSPNGRWLAGSGSDTSTVFLANPETAQQVKVWTMPGPVPVLTFSPDGQFLVTGNANGTVWFLRLDSAFR